MTISNKGISTTHASLQAMASAYFTGVSLSSGPCLTTPPWLNCSCYSKWINSVLPWGMDHHFPQPVSKAYQRRYPDGSPEDQIPQLSLFS